MVRFKWDDERVALMLRVLIDAINNGLRSDNSFKTAVFQRVVDAFEEEGFPPCSTETIRSKRDGLKKDWADYRWLLERTGLGRDPIDGRPTATEAVWDELERMRDGVKKFKHRALPFKAELDIIFLGTSATGRYSQTATVDLPTYELIAEASQQQDTSLNSPIILNNVPTLTLPGTPAPSISASSTSRSSQSSATVSRKRRTKDALIERLIEGIEYEQERRRQPQVTARQLAIKRLEEAAKTWLWSPQQLLLGVKLMKHDNMVDIMLALTDNSRQAWIEAEIEEVFGSNTEGGSI